MPAWPRWHALARQDGAAEAKCKDWMSEIGGWEVGGHGALPLGAATIAQRDAVAGKLDGVLYSTLAQVSAMHVNTAALIRLLFKRCRDGYADTNASISSGVFGTCGPSA